MRKRILVIGASGDIGLAISKKLINEKYDLVVHYNSKKEPLNKLIELANEIEVSCQFVQADLSIENGVEILTSQINDPIDSIVYASGFSIIGLINDVSDEEINRMTQLHIKSLIKVVNYFLPNMVAKKSGSIVVISSIWGQIGASCEVLYSTTKGAQNAYVMALAKELGPSGIKVNAVAPGAVKTNMLNTFSEEDLKEIANEIPMNRLALPSEIANTVNYLISEQSSYITGQILGVNGGWHTS
ncbi:SDR family oxidoreductase [Gottfriedia acidiceleris]|uniref:elongation factor P 5-aminopentanone reductase n=1 Tax=Bacillaceae TaxID=186817 RepID=UPI000BED9B0E|nr:MULTISPECIES: SDR family oxidoreductase [unclassified Bacillus (in: firmicutes)]PEC49700.1 3-ketoacyl-ACP reductase [Bacillus sp. AFS096315]PFM79625.1 3-ketoacyl-ACP reductase [Bacillus sp. AFS077874]